MGSVFWNRLADQRNYGQAAWRVQAARHGNCSATGRVQLGPPRLTNPPRSTTRYRSEYAIHVAGSEVSLHPVYQLADWPTLPHQCGDTSDFLQPQQVQRPAGRICSMIPPQERSALLGRKFFKLNVVQHIICNTGTSNWCISRLLSTLCDAFVNLFSHRFRSCGV